MKISYQVSIDDIIAFNRYHMSHSRAARRIVATQVIAMWVLLIGTSLAIDPGPNLRRVELVAGTAVYAAIATAFLIWCLRRMRDRYARRLYNEGSNLTILGPYELELNDASIVVRTQVVESRIQWKGIEKLVKTEDYAFIYTASVSALIVPKQAMSDREFTQLVDYAEESIALARVV